MANLVPRLYSKTEMDGFPWQTDRIGLSKEGDVFEIKTENQKNDMLAYVTVELY